MAHNLIGALDQGTKNTRFTLFKARSGGEIAYSYTAEHRDIHPQDGWVEQNATEIWENARMCIEECLARVDDAECIKAIGIATQRSAVIVWDKVTGKPLYNNIPWTDTRTATICKSYGDRRVFQEKSGLPVGKAFCAPKLRWLMENVNGVKEALENGTALFGTMDAWLVWNLTGGPNGGVHVTDVSNAGHTLLLNINTCQWDPELCAAFGVPLKCLPVIRSSAEVYGHYTTAGGVKVPIAAVLANQQASLVGQACFEPGQAKVTFRTGCFIMVNTGTSPVHSNVGLLTTPAYKLGPDAPTTYTLESYIGGTAGYPAEWLRDNLGIIESAFGIENRAKQVEDNGGIYFVPAFSGIYADQWYEDARAAIIGMTMYTNANHVCRAVIESVAYQVNDIIAAMRRDHVPEIQRLQVDGHAVVNNTMMQFISDLLNMEVVRPITTDIVGLGAGIAAGLAVGVYENTDDVRSIWRVGRKFQPHMEEDVRKEKVERWHLAVKKSAGWAQ